MRRPVSHHGAHQVAEISPGGDLAAGQRDRVRARRRRRGLVPAGLLDLGHDVGAVGQAGERVVAVAIGGGRLEKVTPAVIEIDGPVGQAGAGLVVVLPCVTSLERREGTSGGGMVVVQMTGLGKVIDLKIDRHLID